MPAVGRLWPSDDDDEDDDLTNRGRGKRDAEECCHRLKSVGALKIFNFQLSSFSVLQNFNYFDKPRLKVWNILVFFLICGRLSMPKYHGNGCSEKRCYNFPYVLGVPVLIFVSGISVLKLFILAISFSVLGISVLKAIDQPERECPGPAHTSCSPV